MMKVKPFSYHIPPRRKVPVNATNSFSSSPPIKNISSCNGLSTSSRTHHHRCNKSSSSSRSDNYRSRRRMNNNNNKNYYTSTTTFIENVFSLCGIGGAVFLLFLGFIDVVAGQGKPHDMEEDGNSPFATQSHISSNQFPRGNLFQLPTSPNLDALGDDNNEDDEMLQRSISSMGQYGAKYTNNSYPYNYSSHSIPLHPRHHYFLRSGLQYKLGQGLRIGPFLPTPSYDSLLLSLRGKEDKDDEESLPFVTRNNLKFGETEKKNKTIIERENTEKVNEEGDAKPSGTMSPAPTIDPKTSNVLRNQSNSLVDWDPPSVIRETKFQTSLTNTSKNEGNQTKEPELPEIIDVGWDELLTLPKKNGGTGSEDGRVPSDDDEDYELDVLEKFIPGNRSHSSGKLRFRQSSQAELDGVAVDLTKNSLSQSANSDSSSRRRPRRSVVHLYDMVVCSTGCNPLIFKGYGCYCGFLGSGLTVDGIDKCCAKHDWCYHHAKCPPLLTYFVPYYWTCNHGRPECVSDFRGWKGICGAHLCECDRQFAECLKKFPCPRSRAINSHSDWHADSRAFPFTVGSRRPKFPHWRQPPIPPPPRIPLLPFPPSPHHHFPMGRYFS